MLRSSVLASSLVAFLALGAAAEPYARVADVRVKDLYAGTLPAADAEIRFESYLAEGSRLTLTVEGDSSLGVPPAAALRLALLGPDGSEIEIAGTNKDKSKPARNRIRWKNVKLAETGLHTFVLSADSAGGWSFRLDGQARDAATVVESETELALGEEAFVDFTGLAGGRVKGVVKAPGKGNRLEAEFTRVVEPDGNVLGAEDLDEKGRLFLLQDGTHRVYFRNVGRSPGSWKADITSRARAVRRRKGFVDADGVSWKPKIEKVEPGRAYHLLREVELLLTGRDLQPGLDVRLVRKNRADILATDIDVVSDTEVRCTVDLDTRETPDGRSVGAWNVGVWNHPEYTEPGDRTSLVKDAPARDEKKTFKSLSDGDIRLPTGTEADTEVFVLEFSGGFATDIRQMGFGSLDPVVEDRARRRLEDYVVLYARHLFRINETNGRTGKEAVPICFVRELPPGPAGTEGVDYDVLQVGGEQEPGDPRDPAESLDWGFVPLDPGNSARGVFRQRDDEGARVGLGVRLRFLDPALPGVAPSWVEAMRPLREEPLTSLDRRYYQDGYFPYTVEEAERMKAISLQTERAAREIAAVVAHHVAKALGVGAGDGPTANPSVAGRMWTERLNLDFTGADLERLRGLPVPHAMPGKAERDVIRWFTLATTVEFRLEDALTDTPYEVAWDLFGGRPNARNSDYRAGYAGGSDKLLGGILKVSGLSGTPPLYRSNGQPYCALENLRINFTDTKHDVRRTIRWQVRVFADLPKLRPPDRPAASSCNLQLGRL